MKTDRYIKNITTTATLMEAGLSMMRENIQRRHGMASSATVDAMLLAWMRRENAPIPGDTDGMVRCKYRRT